jgi:asparagine synthase (glutamine-hydrolysing)
MCGIAGYYGRLEPGRLKEMTDSLTHRGPDDSGCEVISAAAGGMAIGLGHRRLSIIDVEGGHQPMWSPDRRMGIVYNGEIYNFRPLRSELERLGHTFVTRSDTEVILQGWRAWGERVVEHLEGMFAFGIWDEDRQAWFLARDRFGIKPLYYCHPAPNTLAFASEIRALLPLVGGARVRPAAVGEYLLYGWTSSDETIFRGVKQLRPAHALVWRPDRPVAPFRYWRLGEGRERWETREWVDAVRDELDRAVESHLIADVPVGITLSGGLDSSAVLASMARLLPPDRIRAFTIGWGLPDDEIPFARRATAHLGVKARERLASPADMARDFAQCVWHLEEPIAHPVMLTTLALARFVRQDLKVVLIGEGSDELFAGYPQCALLTGPWAWLPRSLIRRSFLTVSYVMPRARTVSRLLTPAMRGGALLEATEHQFDSYFEDGPLPEGALRFEIERQLVHQQLARNDKLMMAYSVEARVPFLDRRFAELAFAVPFGLKVGSGERKQVLRRAMESRLPAEIVRRPKTGKHGTQALLPTLLAAIRHGPLRHLVEPRAIAARGWFDADAVRRYLAGSDHAWIRHHPVESRRRAKFALAIAVLEQWARLFLDGEPSPGRARP